MIFSTRFSSFNLVFSLGFVSLPFLPPLVVSEAVDSTFTILLTCTYLAMTSI